MRARPTAVAVFLFAALVALTGSSAALEPPNTPRVRVGVVNSTEPFVFPSPPGAPVPLQGYDVDLVTTALAGLGLEPVFVSFETVSELLFALESNGSVIDIAASALTLSSERGSLLSYTQPYFSSGLQICVNVVALRQSVAHALFSPAMQMLVMLFVIGLLAFAHVVWLTERWRNPSEYSKSYGRGVWDGLWFSAITAGTVGFGDKVPRSSPGKLVTILLMLWGMLMTALLTATVASSLTAALFTGVISSVGQLNGLRVGLVSGRASADYARSVLSAQFVFFPDLTGAIASLAQQRVDAVIDDSPMLVYAAARSGSRDVRVVGALFDPLRLTLYLTRGSNLTAALDSQLLLWQENGAGNTAYKRWFSTALTAYDESSTRTNVDPEFVYVLTWTTIFIVLVMGLACTAEFAYKTFRQPRVLFKRGSALMRVPLVDADLRAAAESAAEHTGPVTPMVDESYSQARRRMADAQRSRNVAILQALEQPAPWERDRDMEMDVIDSDAGGQAGLAREVAELKAMVQLLLRRQGVDAPST